MIQKSDATFLILFFFLFSNVTFAAFQNKKHTRSLEFLGKYEVVPVKTKHFLKRKLLDDSGPKGKEKKIHPINSEFKFAAFGKNFHAQIEKNLKLFGPNYSEETQIYKDGKLINTKKREWSHDTHNCHYLGNIIGEHSSGVAVSTCTGGFSGSLHVGPEHFGIEPAIKHLPMEHLKRLRKTLNSQDSETFHVVFNMKDTKYPSWSCGVKSQNEQGDIVHHTHTLNVAETFANELRNNSTHNHEDRHGHSHENKRSLKQNAETFVELLVVNDKARYNQLGDAVYDDSASLVNQVQRNYLNSGVLEHRPRVILTSQISWMHGDPSPVNKLKVGDRTQCPDCASGEVSVSVLLSEFDKWRSIVGYQPTHDNCHLFSGYDFEQSTLGYAHVSQMCQQSYTSGINQVTTTYAPAFNAAIITHEMGHNFGMNHDGDTIYGNCDPKGSFMNAIVGSLPTEFSECSNGFMNHHMPSFRCLDNKPTKQFGDPECGNGYIEAGEDCDCGGDNCEADGNLGLKDPCCNGTICKFNQGAECSAIGADSCCNPETCKPVAGGTLCRAAVGTGIGEDQCDVAEYCDGVNGNCPKNLFKASGTPCCEADTCTEGKGLCHQGKCMSHLRQCIQVGQNFQQAFEACSTQSKNNGGEFCGTLWCSAGSLGSLASSCTPLHQADQSVQVQDGIPCGFGTEPRQCLDNSCQISWKLNKEVKWSPEEWSSCSACDIPQSRGVNCVAKSDGRPLAKEQCSTTNRPAESQPCGNISLGCVHATNIFDQDTIRIPFLDDNVSRNTLTFVGLGALALIFVILACCYQAVTYGPALDIVDDDLNEPSVG